MSDAQQSPRQIAEEQQDFLMRLLFDEELRERFARDAKRTLAEEEVLEAARPALCDVDAHGIEVDASMRREYLMSALCRQFPMSATALGTLDNGPRRLSAFLASKVVLGPMAPRTHAFGEHLERLLQTGAAEFGHEATVVLASLLELERARADNATAIRNEVASGGEVPQPGAPTAAQKKRGRVALPPFLLACELPLPTSVMLAALDHPRPENAWQHIVAKGASRARWLSATRSLPLPVTVLSRGFVRGLAIERAGAGGVAPLVDVSHLTVELNGRRSAELGDLNGTRTLKELPVSVRGLAQKLLEQGLLIVGE